MCHRMDRYEKLAEKKKLTTTQKQRLMKKMTKTQEAKMMPEQPCPLSRERNDSVHIRNCKASGTTCSDVKWLFAWRECPIFLNSRSKKRKVVKKRNE